MTVTLLPSGRTLPAEPGQTLLEVLRGAGLSMDAPCGGHGLCGKCRVTLAEPDGDREVLACRTKVARDVTVRLPESAAPGISVLTDDRGAAVTPDPVPPEAPYLAAFDVGTTTVVCYLLDGRTGRQLDCASMLNPQYPFGADVISRIQCALGGREAELTDAIRGGMGQLIGQVCAGAGISPAQFCRMAVVGNPCMQQLFLGISPRNLAAPPFPPALTQAETRPCAPYLPACTAAELLVVPDLSGYVGADTMGCILSARLYEAGTATLLVDIGTNGEMVLGGRDGMVACATAAGPALEGARICCGMRGGPGAIDHVWVEDGALRVSVIGGGEARGICGSGLIDAAAVLVDQGLANRRGRLRANGSPLSDRLRPADDGQDAFFLTDRVFLTQQDVRELQLAKGAIAAGIRLMADALGLTMDAIGRVLLAGAFGSYLRPESACRIGLLPPELAGRVTAIGNAAGAGARLLACRRDQLDLAQRLVGEIRTLELAELPTFQRTFAQCMLLPEG